MAGRFQETRSDALLHTMAASLIIAGAAAFLVTGGSASAVAVHAARNNAPQYAQYISPKSFAVLDPVLPATQLNGSTLFVPPGSTEDSLRKKPFHIFDDEFYAIIGDNPTLTLIAQSDGDPLFHEANVWFPPTDEVFFVQNAGAKAAGTGLNKSSITQKISLAEAAALQSASQNSNYDGAAGFVNVTTVDAGVKIINPNGATNYKDKIAFMTEGQGSDIAPGITLLNPYPPYDTEIILNNYFGRQFNSLNDVAVSPKNKELYFTDVTYGYNQEFRPEPGLPNQVYRFNPDTGLVRGVADAFTKPNGITFSPDGSKAYVTDTGVGDGFFPSNYTRPAGLYQFDVADDGTWGNRKLFAYVSLGLPDGVHCDSKGNVYTGVGDGVLVFNSSGKLIGKIYTGSTSANFAFAGQGRMVICAETELYYATLNAAGANITNYDYSS